jgi:hypothetical protein
MIDQHFLERHAKIIEKNTEKMAKNSETTDYNNINKEARNA